MAVHHVQLDQVITLTSDIEQNTPSARRRGDRSGWRRNKGPFAEMLHHLADTKKASWKRVGATKSTKEERTGAKETSRSRGRKYERKGGDQVWWRKGVKDGSLMC